MKKSFDALTSAFMRSTLLCMILFCGTACFAQGGDPLHQLESGPDWVNASKNGYAPGWLYYSELDMSDRLATSTSPRFPVGNASDGFVTTAWSPLNSGIGDVIVVDFESKSSIWWIWNGYGKSSPLFLSNNRARRVRILLLGTYCSECAPSLCVLGNFVVVNSIETELEDINDFQMLPIPQKKIVNNSSDCGKVKADTSDERNYIYKLGIQILTVYPGTDPKGTYLSEIMDHASYTSWLKRPGKK